MGIQVEFNPDLALRNFLEFKEGNRKKEECLPNDLKEGEICEFLKEGQRNYWMDGDIPLLETKGNGVLSRPIASIIIIEVTHFKFSEKIYTKGKYKIVEIFKDNKIRFDGFKKIK